MPCSGSISCGELISSVPLSLGHLKGREVSPRSTKTRGNHGCSLLSEECEKAAAAALVLRQVWFVVCSLGFGTRAPVQTGAPHCSTSPSKPRSNPSVQISCKNTDYCTLGHHISALPSPHPAHSHTAAVARLKIIFMPNKPSGNCT